ncbi:MAG: hypothetical protein JW765_08350, partial [Deltaproteobacteria bacterium]|nr:hypothetical protein [Candidatus Zymogenaceae bacterium]
MTPPSDGKMIALSATARKGTTKGIPGPWPVLAKKGAPPSEGLFSLQVQPAAMNLKQIGVIHSP